MEELYILSDGSTVDISSYSQFEKTNFLIKNPKAKKQNGVAKSAVATSTKAKVQNGQLKQEDGPLVSKRLRLANEVDLTTMQGRGILPPPSEQPMSTADTENLYGDKTTNDYKNLLVGINKLDNKKNWKDRAEKLDKGVKKENIYTLNQNSIEHVDSEKEVADIKEKIRKKCC